VTTIENYVFEFCDHLTGFSVDSASTSFAAADGVLFSKDGTVLLCYPEGRSGTSYSIPSGVKRIAPGAFYSCDSLTSITIPSSVTTIEDSAFRYCAGLSGIIFPYSVKTIGDAAFQYCNSLTSIALPEGLAAIGKYAFNSCSSLSFVTLPDSLTCIGMDAFGDCSALTEIYFRGKAPTDIGGNSFKNVNAAVYYLPLDSWTEGIRQNYGGTLTWICNNKCGDNLTWKLSDGVLTISGTGDMWDCDISPSPWYNQVSSITSAKVSAGVTNIGFEAFYGCGALTSITIPDSVKSIGMRAFGSCTALKKISFGGGAPSIEASAFEDVTATAYYPATNTSWTASVRQNYGGTITWKAVWPCATPVLSSAVNAVGGVKVTWNAVTGAEKYRVFVKTGSDSWKEVGDTTGTSLTVKTYGKSNNNTPLVSGTTYTFTVRCLSADGKSFTSAYNKTGISVTYVAAPVLKSAANAATGVQVTWKASAGAAKYRVFRKTADGGWAKVGDTTGTSFTDKTAVSGTTYWYTVRCLSADGKSFTSAYDTTGLKVAYIAAPVLKSAANTTTGVQVTWKASAGAAQYRVFRKTSGGSWAKVGDTTGTSFTDKTAVSGTTYYYTVRCLSADGKSFTSAYNTAGLTITYIAAPVLKSVANTAAGQVTVTWTKSAGAAKYRVFRKVSGGSWAKVGDTTGASFVDKTAVKGTTYYYTVRCLSADGKSFTSAYNTTGLMIKVTK